MSAVRLPGSAPVQQTIETRGSVFIQSRLTHKRIHSLYLIEPGYGGVGHR